ncbi:MAG: sulfatase family protein [Promethearchaeia archaeon]
MNVLFIITDQQRKDHLSCYGNKTLKTPNIDSIAKEGVRFTNYFCSNPMCMPNRATLFTGLIPSVHGVRSNGINLDMNIPTITEVLSKKGYFTINVGKTHFQFYSPAFSRKNKSYENTLDWTTNVITSKNIPKPYYGFEENILTCGHGDALGGHYFEWLKENHPDYIDYVANRIRTAVEDLYFDTEMPEEIYPTNFIADKTIEFLENFADGKYNKKNFFLHCSFPDPHHPVCPPGRFKELYKPDDIELPPTFYEYENLLNHKFLGELLKNELFSSLVLHKTNEEELKTFMALTYGSIATIDNAIGNILSALQRYGLESNTMIIFSSDHGDLMGDYGMLLKGPAHYRGLINIPLLWKIPSKTKGSVSDSLISSVDIPKTLLNLLKIREKQQPKGMQGFDATPILLDPNAEIRDRILIEEDEEVLNLKIRLRTLVTKEYRITLYENHEDFGDIFSYKDDPNEINNLWYSNKELRFDLMDKLLREMIKNASVFPERQAVV